MKVFFRGYAKTDAGCRMVKSFENFDVDDDSEINITYSYALLLSEGEVYHARSFEELPHKNDRFLISDIIQVSGDNDPVIALSDDSILYKLSLNEAFESTVDAIPRFFPANTEIVKIASGAKITVALSASGEIFNVPNRLNFKHRGIVDVVVGREHCILLDKRGNIYTFGSGR